VFRELMKELAARATEVDSLAERGRRSEGEGERGGERGFSWRGKVEGIGNRDLESHVIRVSAVSPGPPADTAVHVYVMLIVLRQFTSLFFFPLSFKAELTIMN
jgi:hypothetical protein